MLKQIRIALVWTQVILLLSPAPAAFAAHELSDGSTLAGGRGIVGSQPIAAASVLRGNTGAATQSFGIKLPPGTGGMTPQLALRYSSNGPKDSWVGTGWTLGFRSISRSLKYGTPSYDDTQDVFLFDGQELVPDGTIAGRYHTRRQSFLRISHIVSASEDTWTVERKDGTILRFGLTIDSRLENNDAIPFEWLLSEQEDLHGNVVIASYDDLADTGQSYLKEIRYTLRAQAGGSPTSIDGDSSRDRIVSFRLSGRPDDSINFAAGFERHLDSLMDQIDIHIGTELESFA